MSKIRVLVVDESLFLRDLFSEELKSDSTIEVVGTAKDLITAKDKLLELKPDVMTINIEMKEINSIQLLRLLMPHYPIPVIVISSLTKKGVDLTFEALENGAVDFISRPEKHSSEQLKEMMVELKSKLITASQIDINNYVNKKSRFFSSNTIIRKKKKKSDFNIIAIGASTGGTDAILNLLCQLPLKIPGIVIVQHFPYGYSSNFADRLNNQTIFSVKEAVSGDQVQQGHVYIAPGGKQMKVIRSNEINFLICEKSVEVNGFMPSVSVLFDSIAENIGSNALGILLTGMGDDGANAIKNMKLKGSYTIGQDEGSSVVYGMSKAANEVGGLCEVVPIDQIGSSIIHQLEAV